MFSPRLIAVLAFAATVAAIPTSPTVPQPITTIPEEEIENPWLSFPLFGNLFAPLWKLFPSFADIGPRIVADDDMFQVVVNVKDYKTSDLKVKVKGEFIFIQGTHEAKQDDRDLFASQFFHTYSLPANCSGSDVTAELTSDGNLVVTAPIKGVSEKDKEKEIDREVPIVETGKPYKEEGEKTTPVVISTTVEDKKEPTTVPTPADREEVTEKDNIIPHGNEIQP